MPGLEGSKLPLRSGGGAPSLEVPWQLLQAVLMTSTWPSTCRSGAMKCLELSMTSPWHKEQLSTWG